MSRYRYGPKSQRTMRNLKIKELYEGPRLLSAKSIAEELELTRTSVLRILRQLREKDSHRDVSNALRGRVFNVFRRRN